MEEFYNIFIIFITVFLIYSFYQSKYGEVKMVRSEIDGKEYLVRNSEKFADSEESADTLAIIRNKLITLTNYLEDKDPKSVAVKRLLKNFKPDNITESPKSSKFTSYSVNKGEKIVFCLRSKDKDQKLIDINTLTFVALHELSHVMTKSVGHTEEFWDNFSYLLKNSIKIGIYKYQNFKKKPVKYCGIKITDTPYQLDK